MKRPFIALAIFALGCPLPAQADSFPWSQKQTTDQGCFLYQYDESIAGMESNPQPHGYI